jgi:hypothetical protein
MKNLTTLVATSVLLLSATAANAHTFRDLSEKSTIMTEAASSRAQAYQFGANKLSALKSASQSQLTNNNITFSLDVDESSVRLENGAYVTVQERMDANGKIAYVGLVNFEISYTQEDSEGDSDSE